MLSLFQDYSGMLLTALCNTLLLTLLALVFAMLVGLVFAMCNVSHLKVFRLIGTVYVDAIRGVPLIVLAFFIYFGIPQGIKMLGFDFRLTALEAGVAAPSTAAPTWRRFSAPASRALTAGRWRRRGAWGSRMRARCTGSSCRRRSG